MIYNRVKTRLKKMYIKKRVEACLKKISDSEANAMLDYLKKNELTYFNYEWFHNYDSSTEYPIFEDHDGRLFIKYYGHNMYFKKGWGKERIREYLDNLFPEQDKKSPHLYFADGEKKNYYSVIVDAGVAEGMFALELIERTDKMYLIECDEEWIEAIERTFAPFRDKIVIIKKFLSDKDDDYHCTLDSILQLETSIDLIKMDIEGAEMKALQGVMTKLPCVKEFLICVYHYQDEEKEVRDFFSNKDYNIRTRKGYIFFKHDPKQKPPYIRKGVLLIQQCAERLIKV